MNHVSLSSPQSQCHFQPVRLHSHPASIDIKTEEIKKTDIDMFWFWGIGGPAVVSVCGGAMRWTKQILQHDYKLRPVSEGGHTSRELSCVDVKYRRLNPNSQLEMVLKPQRIKPWSTHQKTETEN